MARARKPGPVGSSGVPEPIDVGTLIRQAMPKPGPIDCSQPQPPGTGSRPARSFGVQRPSLPFLRQGDAGDNVRKLQSFLNFRLELRPPLRVDGYFLSLTRKAVVEFQTSRSLRADGEVGEETWYHLLTGTQAATAGGANPTSLSGYPPWQPPTDNVIGWTIQAKLDYVVGQVPGKLPSQLRAQLAGLMPVQYLAVMLAGIADSVLFAAAKLPGRRTIATHGGQGIFALAQPTQTIVLAITKPELDEAVGQLTQAIETLGVATLSRTLAEFDRSAGGGAGSEANAKKPPPPPPRRLPTPPPERSAPPPEEPVFLPNVDAAAMAAAMRAAAQSGTPFCLE